MCIRDCLGFYHYASPAWSEAGRDATAAWLDALASALRLAGRVRVAAEGVNATLSGASRDVAAFVAALRAVPGDGWPGVEYKVEACGPGAAWPRLVVWTAEELCGFGAGAAERRALDATGPGAALDPRAFHARLSDAGGARPPVLVDVRNGYETRVGGFRAEGLETLDPGTRTFADFAAWLDAPATREALGGRDVLMYCTGGVRCERATAALRTRLPEAERGRVFHLRGGIVKYLEAHGDGGHFVGANYVFDRRNRHGAAPRGSADVLGSCDGCAAPWDVYRGSHACASCAGKLLLCDACLSRPKAGRECEMVAATEKRASSMVRRRPRARGLLADAQHHDGLIGHITIFESTSDLLPAWLIKVEPPATRVLVRVRDVLVRRPVDDDRAPLRIGAARAAAAAHRRPPRRRRSPKAARALQNLSLIHI